MRRMKHPFEKLCLRDALVVSLAAIAPAAAYIDPGTGSMLLQMHRCRNRGRDLLFPRIADQAHVAVFATRGACGRGQFGAAARRSASLIAALASSRSFRDPDATLVEHEGRLIRAVRGHALDDFRRMLEDPVVRKWMDEGRIVRTRPLPRVETPPQYCRLRRRVLRARAHRVRQPAGRMGAGDAGGRRIADPRTRPRALLPRGWQLKDATPANVLFRNCGAGFRRPAFDRSARPSSCLWIARHQFETTFLLPLDCLGRGGIADLLDSVESRCRPLARGAGRQSSGAALDEAAALAHGRAAGRARREGGRGRRDATRDEGRERRTGALHPGRSLAGLAAAVEPMRVETRGAKFPLASLHGDAQPLRQRRPAGQANVHRRCHRRHAAAAHARYRREHRRIQRDRREPGRGRRARHRRALGCGDLGARPDGRAAGSSRSSAISVGRRRRSAGAIASSSRCLAARPAASTWS